eukprot:CAMPEP_0180654722 /NCGR_PEP_ID=MMETSP1037_2-20121125/54866_1 /TAXON_ID=632150 /ORGANISM="Azadinium spinosum, Strain 3D9" /LENGTH=61 /DNA_ID=CAMNT_0022681049 /DNA_START=362 /DNA_END=547 /DNA_ORIENTATION=+
MRVAASPHAASADKQAPLFAGRGRAWRAPGLIQAVAAWPNIAGRASVQAQSLTSLAHEARH